MSRRFVAIIVAVACVLIAGGIAGWLLLGSKSGSGSGSAPTTRVPASKAIGALQQVAQPVAIGPLDGSVESPGVSGAYTIAKSCAETRSAYRAAGAPIPVHATVADGPNGTLIVTDVYGDPEGILFTDRGAGSCGYAISSQPTLEIAGAGPIPAGEYWATVGCVTLFGDPAKGLEAASFTAGDKPWFIFAGTPKNGGPTAPPPADYSVTIGQATLDQVRATAGSSSELGTQYPVALSATADGRIIAKLGGDGSGQTFAFTCTTQIGRVLGIGASAG